MSEANEFTPALRHKYLRLHKTGPEADANKRRGDD